MSTGNLLRDEDFFRLPLFGEKFKNDITPLDEDNLNILLEGVQRNRASITKMDETFATDTALTTEEQARISGDQAIAYQVWGLLTPPTDDDTIYKLIIDERDARSALGKKLYGADEIPSHNSLTLKGINKRVEDHEKSVTEELSTKANAGETQGALAEINTALDSLEDKDLQEKQPSCSITVTVVDTSNKSLQGSSWEYGTQVAVKYTEGTFEDGKYKYGCIDTGTGDKYTSDQPTGVTLGGYKITFNGTSKMQSDTERSFLYTVTPDSGTQTVTGEFSYVNSSKKTPISNLGRKVESQEFPESMTRPVTLSGTTSVSGYRQGCFYGTVSTDITADDITSDLIRGLTKLNRGYSAGDISFDVPVGATAIFIACPELNTGLVKVQNNTVNSPMMSRFTKVKTLTVSGAGADAGVRYNVWMFKPPAAYSGTANLTITLG